MEENNKKTYFKYFSAEAGIVIVVIVVILGVLLYLGVLPNPIPKKTSVQENKIIQANTPTITVEEKGYGCIFAEKLCAQGETITEENKPAPTFYGIGFTNIPDETPIKAAISGKIGIGLTTDPKTDKKINTLSITNDSLRIEANYSFVGKPFEPTAGAGGNIKKGDTIGWMGDSKVTFRQNPKTYSLIFSVMDLASKEFKKLELSDLK